MSLETHALTYLNELKDIWQQKQALGNIFAYKLEVKECKHLPGQYGFYVEHNPERSSKRRQPQCIPSLKTPFDGNKFNFTKINEAELISVIPYKEQLVSLIVNQSPLSQYHTLICPNLEACLPQSIDFYALDFCINFLCHIQDRTIRIGYNSPGALASVNHQHFHLMSIFVELYIDKAELTTLDVVGDKSIYRLSENMPTEAICFIINRAIEEEAMKAKIETLYNFIDWLYEMELPHNLFMTTWQQQHETENLGNLKIFVFVRQHYCDNKRLGELNIGFCELSGFVPIGDYSKYTEITEQQIIEKIRQETGDVYNKLIYKYFQKNQKKFEH